MAKTKSKKYEPDDEEAGRLRLGIVGHGFVGQAVDFAFTHQGLTKFYVDPKHDTTVDDLVDWEPQIVFICAPTPMSESGFVDASIVEDAVLKLLEHTKAMVVIKSTVTPDIIDRLYNSLFKEDIHRLLYNPEFLTEANAKRDFVNAPFHVIGCVPGADKPLTEFYGLFSNCLSTSFAVVSPMEASYIKYTINSYLAMKVTFFNQLYDSCKKNGVNWHSISRVVSNDARIGPSHMTVPGFDSKQGYGGACFPKDTLAFTKYDKDLTLLAECITINNEYRSQYELDDREKAQNVSYEQITEELENQDDGDTVGE
jgi:nucleotide sugar dehydrogenase